jgi:hypothetical protein
MTSNKIIVPNLFKGLHLGSSSCYERLKHKWFEQKEFDKDNFMHKALIFDINYGPDEIYCNTDGHGGTCWIANIFDSANGEQNTYHFRNFIDLVDLFDKKGYKFIE